MEATLSALRTIELIVTTATGLALLVLAVKATGRRLMYVGVMTYLAHVWIYSATVLTVTNISDTDRTFFLYWVIGLRLHATLLLLAYGIYFTRLLALQR